MYNDDVAVEFEAFVLIGNIIQSKTAAVFSAARHRPSQSATQLPSIVVRVHVGPRSDRSGLLDDNFMF